MAEPLDISDINKEFSLLIEEIRSGFEKVATKDFVESKIADAKFQIIVWFFLFWIAQLAAIFAFLKFFIK